MLEVEQLTKRFGGLVAVKNLSFSVRGGEILGLIGPNGSSTRTSLGCCAIALASSMRRRSANASVGGLRSSTAPRPTRPAIARARSSISALCSSMPRRSGMRATLMFSSTVCRFSGRECWNTMPNPLRAILCAGRPATFSP